MVYNRDTAITQGALTIVRTDEFIRWLNGLADVRAKAKIAGRLDMAATGHFGDCKPAGEGLSEMRIDYGPGYRLYLARRGAVVYIVLWGGDKDSRQRDIKRAKAIWKGMGK
jgi:putative addiction module killer protein